MTPSIARTLARIAAEHDVSPAEVLSRSRRPQVVRAREHAIAVTRWSTGLSTVEIGRVFGLDHSSVITAVRRYERELNGEPRSAA